MTINQKLAVFWKRMHDRFILSKVTYFDSTNSGNYMVYAWSGALHPNPAAKNKVRWVDATVAKKHLLLNQLQNEGAYLITV